ncbi:immunity protein YezG family protein [Listeria booriae]|uniref:DUF600 family protein n=1 Tax=Listeria booriae TaxID=1552123 RepID=A0A7X0XWB0_9LIST|nr:immunity protein YezG family protein [Listeria booriae]MBC1792949.1 DUF600 family protein [Listeria booriae]MBC1800710.1 DUF600 family protein [Listeria booriae]MBC1803848.1 DUF600 family protein [Listeria booriae]
MNTEIMEQLYQEIATQVGRIIPEEWDKFLLYSEVDEDREASFFYYYPKGSDTPIYNIDIEDMDGVDEDIVTEEMKKLRKALRSLWNEFIVNKQEPWTSINFIMDASGEFELNYGYADLEENGYSYYERMLIWEYENLGLFPEDDPINAQLIENHIKRATAND